MCVVQHWSVILVINYNYWLGLFADKLSITVTSDDVLIGEGRTVTFSAKARGIGNLSYQWRKRGSNSLPDKVLGSDTLNLTISNIENSDKGDYYCVATNMWERSMESNNVTLNVYGMLVYVQICWLSIIYGPDWTNGPI